MDPEKIADLRNEENEQLRAEVERLREMLAYAKDFQIPGGIHVYAPVWGTGKVDYWIAASPSRMIMVCYETQAEALDTAREWLAGEKGVEGD